MQLLRSAEAGVRWSNAAARARQVGIPTMISFAAIIFKDEAYTPWLGQLAKLAFLGSAVHQAVFTLASTLPFAVGQARRDPTLSLALH